MYIEELKEGDDGYVEFSADVSGGTVVISNTKRVLVGAGARALFYPTLLYNVVRNKIQTEFRWWDRVDQFILLGAVPFPADVLRLKELGVGGVVTLNESYETLVPTSLYRAHEIDHLVIPTRDYLFAPSYDDICKAVEFIHGKYMYPQPNSVQACFCSRRSSNKLAYIVIFVSLFLTCQENASAGKTTYVHCKAGRGRSTTIVLCYLVKHKQMTPEAAYEYVKSIRPRVCLASLQWTAVQDYYLDRVKKHTTVSPGLKIKPEFEPFDDASVVLVAESDLEGYKESVDSGLVGNHTLAELRLVCRSQFASQAAMGRLSWLWLGCHDVVQKIPTKELVSPEHMGDVGMNIQVHCAIGMNIQVR